VSLLGGLAYYVRILTELNVMIDESRKIGCLGCCKWKGLTISADECYTLVDETYDFYSQYFTYYVMILTQLNLMINEMPVLGYFAYCKRKG
jgi:hypothetical protein